MGGSGTYCFDVAPEERHTNPIANNRRVEHFLLSYPKIHNTKPILPPFSPTRHPCPQQLPVEAARTKDLAR